MNLNSNSHIYQATPPYLNNRELPSIMMTEILSREKALRPEATNEELWASASSEVEGKCGMVWFGISGVSMPETDALDRAIAALYNDHARDKASEMEQELRRELAKKHVSSINNLELDGEVIPDFDTFYRRAPRELVRWVCDAIYSHIVLSGSERKNFMPASVSPV